MNSFFFHNVEYKNIVVVQIMFNYGAVFEPIHKNGYVHLLEHLKVASNPFEDMWHLKKTFTGVTAKEFLKFTFFTTKDKFERGLQELMKCLLTFNASDQMLIEQKKQVINEIIAYNSRSAMFNVLKTIECIYNGSGLANCAGGDIDTVKAITRDQLIDYNRTIFEKSPYLISCTGDITGLEKTITQIDSFNLCEKGNGFRYLINKCRTHGVLKVKRINENEFILVYKLPGKKNEDYVKTRIIEYIIRNAVAGHSFQVKLFPFFSESLLLLRAIAQSIDTLKYDLEMLNERLKKLICEEVIAKAIESLGEEYQIESTSLGWYADNLLECDCFSYSIQEILKHANKEFYYVDIKNLMEEMLRSGLLCKTITEELAEDPVIALWEPDLNR